MPRIAATRCCRTSPRCRDCPVLLAARAPRAPGPRDDLAALVEEVFRGAPPRPMPEPLATALLALDDLREHAGAR